LTGVPPNCTEKLTQQNPEIAAGIEAAVDVHSVVVLIRGLENRSFWSKVHVRIREAREAFPLGILMGRAAPRYVYQNTRIRTARTSKVESSSSAVVMRARNAGFFRDSRHVIK